ncbi:di-heme oxidoreductase family protein [Magnetococcus sp. PR-3]|uniref:di-heme oxidoreductase family protein n=1 Tax=Magnetococcus sp. PR-3 TaxID=3120355 RepID=UPI003FA55A8F
MQSTPGLTPEAAMDFRVGHGFFKRLWVSAPASTQAADGLGPLFNAWACRSCHINNGRGAPPKPGEKAISLFLRLSVPPTTERQKQQLASGHLSVIPEPTYGSQLQNFALQGHNIEGELKLTYQESSITLSDGEQVSLRTPTYGISKLGYGPLHPQTMISPRLAPPMVGLGLLEAIAASDIEAMADPDDNDGDGISGRVNRVWEGTKKRMMIGRFGWKAGHATVDAQSQGAAAGDLGLSVPNHQAGYGDCTKRQPACQKAPDGNSPQFENLEIPRKVSDLIAHYTRHIAVPKPRLSPQNAQHQEGRLLFKQAGCHACHKPSYTTASDGVEPTLAGQSIQPYTDLLLHDMGQDLADNRPEAQADGHEWRTPPLWGIGLTGVVNPNRYYLHDGRARSLLEAILWHGGEAQQAKDRVVAMNKKQRQALLSFLKGL